MAVIKQTIAYWMDYYRCEPTGFTTWDVDSYIAYIEIGINQNGRRVGERPPKLGWAYENTISYDLGGGVFVEKDIVRRARGGIYIEEDTDTNDVIRELTEYRLDIAERPLEGFDQDCGAESSTAASEFEESAQAASSEGFVSSTQAFSSAFEEVSSAFDGLSSAAEAESSLFVGSSLIEEASSAEASSAITAVSSSPEISSGLADSSTIEEILSSLEETSSAFLEISSAPEESSALFESSLVEESSALVEVSSEAEASSVFEESSAIDPSSLIQQSSEELSQGSSSADLCTLKGCPGGVYAASTDPGLFPLAGVTDAVNDLSTDADADCAITEGYVCGFEGSSTEVFPGFYQVSASWCCVLNEQVVLEMILGFDADPGEQERFYVAPGSNPHPLNQETDLTDFYETSASSASDIDFPLPNRLANIAFTTGWPKRCCLEDGVTTIDVYGDFTGPVTQPLVLTYKAFVSDLFYEGLPTFNIENPALPSMTRLTKVVITLDDCECTSSSEESM